MDYQRLTMVFETKRNGTFGYCFGSHGFMFRPQKPGGASGRGFKKHAAGMWSLCLCTSIRSGNCVRQCSSRWVSSIKERTFVSDSPILGRKMIISEHWSHWSTGKRSLRMDKAVSADVLSGWWRPWSSAMARRQQLGPYPECGHNWARPWSGGSSAGNLWGSGRKNHPIDCIVILIWHCDDIYISASFWDILHKHIIYIYKHPCIYFMNGRTGARSRGEYLQGLSAFRCRFKVWTEPSGTMERNQNEFSKKLVIHQW